MNNKEQIYAYRYIARLIIEAATPLAVGSGEKSIMTDALVATDVNGLPYIPGTAIAGVVRHALEEMDNEKEVPTEKDKYTSFFGFQVPGKSQEGMGSHIIFTDAVMIGDKGLPLDGVQEIDWSQDFYAHYRELPIRQHVRINDKGTACDAGKFDEQIVYKGTRFCFEIEMVWPDENGYDKFCDVIGHICSPEFRIGGGTRNGFGKISVASCHTKKIDLGVAAQRDFYVHKSSSLACSWEGDEHCEALAAQDCWDKYELTLQPQDFILFGSGFGDDEADATPVKESIVQWDANGRPLFKDGCIVIPATSVKGALLHRTVYYWNLINGHFADKDGENDALTASQCPAVKFLFGCEDNKGSGQRGNVLFDDIIETPDGTKENIANHVSIDRFTGGSLGGMLFNEKTLFAKEKNFTTTLLVKKTCEESKVYEALKKALIDICRGLLPLGGSINRGNGTFTGTLEINGDRIYPKEE